MWIRKILRPDGLYERSKIRPEHRNYIVAGPGIRRLGHGKEPLREIPFGSDTAVYFRQRIEAPWFAFG